LSAGAGGRCGSGAGGGPASDSGIEMGRVLNIRVKSPGTAGSGDDCRDSGAGGGAGAGCASLGTVRALAGPPDAPNIRSKSSWDCAAGVVAPELGPYGAGGVAGTADEGCGWGFSWYCPV